MPLLEGVQIGEARHVYSWGNPNGGNPDEISLRESGSEKSRHMYSWGNLDEGNLDENMCHVSSRNVCHVSSGGGVLTSMIFCSIGSGVDFTWAGGRVREDREGEGGLIFSEGGVVF